MYILPCVKQIASGNLPIYHRELSSGLWGNLDGWEGALYIILLKTGQFENKVRQIYFLYHTIHSKPLPCEEKYTILVYW